MIRVLLAGLFVFGALLGVVIVIDYVQSGQPWPGWAAPALVLGLFTALALALQFFNVRGQRLTDSAKSAARLIEELDAAGLVSRQKFRALRCFAVEEREDEGLHFYLELADRRVLFLSGQYLYDYQAIRDDPELNRPASFPCEKFEILRHKGKGHVLALVPEGKVLVPECQAPPFSSRDFKRGMPEDGAILADKTFEELKRARLA